MRQTVLILSLLVLCSLWVGCSQDTGGRVAVSGAITLNGQPLDSGTIQFTSLDGSVMSGATIAAGKYKVPAAQGLLPGKYTVRVSSVSEAPANEQAPGDSAEVEAQNKELIPEEFNAHSKVTADIEAGKANTFDLAIP